MLTNLWSVLLLVALLDMSQAQRPSFAGSRPPGGLSQKDKYLGTQNTAVENLSGLSIGTRFGEETVSSQAPINLPYGASQKPPVGVPLVLPISAYVPAASPTARPSTVNVVNRFGDNDAIAPQSGLSFVPSSSASFVPASSASFSPASSASFIPASSASFVPASSASFVPTSSASTPIASSSVPVVSNALPIDAHGDQEYVNYLNTLPEGNRPFWFVNYQAIEALRNSTNPNVNPTENRGSFFAG